MVDRHGPVIPVFGGAELVVGFAELFNFGVLIGEGLGGAHAGDGGLQLLIDARQLALDFPGGAAHAPALEDGEPHEDGHHQEHRHRQLPADREHYPKSPHQGDQGDEQVFRPVVGKLGNFEQVASDPAHELAGTVLIIKAEGELLHMGEQVPADVGLDAYPQHVAPVGDDEVKAGAQYVGPHQNGHDGEEGSIQLFRQQVLHGQAGEVGEGQVYQGNEQGTHHIQHKKAPVGPVIGHKNGQGAFAFHLLTGHGASPLPVDRWLEKERGHRDQYDF